MLKPKLKSPPKGRIAFAEALEGRTLLTNYYISDVGSDSAAGTSTAAAWKTIAKVNTVAFKAGDQILFQGGKTFTGMVQLDALDTGTTAAPIVVGTYGTGRATIDGGNSSAFYAYNTAGFSVKDLDFKGSGRLNNFTNGVVIYADKVTTTKFSKVHFDSVTVSGYGKEGFSLGSGSGSAGYNDVRITNSSFFDNGNSGLFTYAAVRNVHTNVYVGKVRAYGNSGNLNISPEVTGSGILLGNVNGATIEYSVAFNNGATGNGGAGIWTYDSTKVLIQYCEAYQNKTSGSFNGDGFDLDRSVSLSTIQYCYAHENDGAGISMVHKETNTNYTGNTVRYNVMQNNARKIGVGELNIYGKVTNSNAYNNSIYSTSVTGVSGSGIKVNGATGLVSSNMSIRNNVIQTTGGRTLVYIHSSQSSVSSLKFQGNAYWSSGSTFRITQSSSTYSSLNSWRNARGKEKSSTGAAYGYQVDPKFTAAGKGQTFGDATLLTTLTAYKLQSTSALINKGLNLKTLFNTTVGTRDYWGDSLPQRGSYDIGADEVV